MKVFFVRHGETDHNLLPDSSVVANDAALNEMGLLQAKAVAAKLTLYSPTHIYSSPLRRAQQTAQIIANTYSTSVETTKALLEFDIGDWSELAGEVIKQRMIEADVWNYSEHKFGWRVPGGESWQDVHGRVKELIETTVNNSDVNSTIVFVTHNNIVRAANGILRNKPFKEWFGYHISNGTAYGYELQDDSTWSEIKV